MLDGINATRPPSTEPPSTDGPSTDGRATRWDAHKTRRRADVLDAAVETVAEHGAGVSVKQIAERVGLPRPVVYRHFRDRHDLDEHIRQTITDRLMAELVPMLAPDGTPRDAIRHAIGTYLGWIERYPRLHQFLGSGSNRGQSPGSRAVSGTKTAIGVHLRDLLSEWLRALDIDTDFAEPIAFGSVGLVDATVNRWLGAPGSTLTSARLCEFLSVSIWNLIDGQLRHLGAELDPETTLSELLADQHQSSSGSVKPRQD